MQKLISAVLLVCFSILAMTIITSCQKEEIVKDVQSNTIQDNSRKKVVSNQLSNDGILTIKANGTYEFSNEKLLAKVPYLASTFATASQNIAILINSYYQNLNLPVENLVLEIKDGKILSSNDNIIPTGMWADNFLVNYGNLSVMNGNFEVTFSADGSFTINNALTNEFLINLMNEKLTLGGENLKSKLSSGQTITLSVNQYSNLSSSNTSIVPAGDIKDIIPTK